MNLEQLRTTIQQLSGIDGVSGDEGAVREYILEQIKDYCDCQVTPLGNLVAVKKGRRAPQRRWLFSAHMDEVGFLITHITEDGYLKFTNVGGIDERVLIGKPVRINGSVYGVVGTKAVHIMSQEERDAAPKFSDMYIDIGASSRQEATERVQVGDCGTFCTEFFSFGDGYFKGKALDDRAGCALLIALAQSDLPYDCTLLFSVQEETGLAGATAAGHQLQPEIAIAVENTTAADVGGVPKESQVCRLGNGPVLPFTETVTKYDRQLVQYAKQVAQEKQIPHQVKEGAYGGTEARAFQTAGCGARVMAVSLPCRYLHSPACVLQERDLEPTLALLKGMLEGNPAFD